MNKMRDLARFRFQGVRCVCSFFECGFRLIDPIEMSSFVLQPGYAELAKTVHSISGSVTTCFLFTRLWARSTRLNGLWRDDYIRKPNIA